MKKTMLTTTLASILAFGSISPMISTLPAFAQDLYLDVSDTNPDYAGIKFCQEQQIMTGKSQDIFDPEGTLTRGEMATVLWRLEGSPEATSSGFFDVPESSFYKQASSWAKEAGLMTGNDHGSYQSFDGQNPLTKEQAMLSLARYANTYLGGLAAVQEQIPSWTEAASDWAKEAVNWAAGNDLVRTDADGTLNPKDPSARGWVATLIQRLFDSSYAFFDVDDVDNDLDTSLPNQPDDFINSDETSALNMRVKSILSSFSWDILLQSRKDSGSNLITLLHFSDDGTFSCKFKNKTEGSGSYSVTESQDVTRGREEYTSILTLNNFSTPIGLVNQISCPVRVRGSSSSSGSLVFKISDPAYASLAAFSRSSYFRGF